MTCACCGWAGTTSRCFPWLRRRRASKPCAAWEVAEGPRGYTAWREAGWGWLALAGPALDRVLARLCAVDLPPGRVPPDAIAQTRFAGIDAVVLRDGASAEILFDIAATSDMLGQIAHAAQTEGGP